MSVREQIETVLSAYYGALTSTAIEDITNKIMVETETEVEKLQREVAHYERMLIAFCPCDPNPATTDGPQRDCPIHGDGTTFAAWITEMQNELAQRRASVTTGGPAPGFTTPPEEISVALPVTDEEAATRYDGIPRSTLAPRTLGDVMAEEADG